MQGTRKPLLLYPPSRQPQCVPPVTPHHPLFNCPTGDVSGSEEEGSEEGAGSDGGAAAAPGSWFAAGSDDEGGAPAVDLRRLEDLSVHLCFICVLHLANEHGLAVAGVTGLDRLLVSNVPAAA